LALSLLPYPDFLSWQDWADTVVGYNEDLYNQVSPDLPWQDFARRIQLVAPDVPSPEGHEDWRRWVYATKQALNL
jgi:hypothetical protein